MPRLYLPRNLCEELNLKKDIHILVVPNFDGSEDITITRTNELPSKIIAILKIREGVCEHDGVLKPKEYPYLYICFKGFQKNSPIFLDKTSFSEMGEILLKVKQ